MKASSIVLVVSAVALGAAAAWWVSARSARAPADDRAPPRVEVRNALRACWTDAVPEPALPPGAVAFAAESGARVLSVFDATAYPLAGDRPEIARWADLAALRLGANLDLRPYLRTVSDGRDVVLRYTLQLAAADGVPEFRCGWAAVRRRDLDVAGVRVTASERDPLVAEVRTAVGQAVPGAMVVIDCPGYPPGLVSHLAQCGPTGRVRISGVAVDDERVAGVLEGGSARRLVPLRAAAPGGVLGLTLDVSVPLAFRAVRIDGLGVNEQVHVAVRRREPAGRAPDGIWIVNPSTPSSAGHSVTVLAATESVLLSLPDVRVIVNGERSIDVPSASWRTPDAAAWRE